MENFFQKPAFNGNGLVSGFRDMNGTHVSTFDNGTNHLTFGQPFNDQGDRHDFSFGTQRRLNEFNQMGGLEQRVSILDAFNNSPFNH
ncbi:MAG: hypothetical protein K9G47_08775 [Bacteroidales bacterium]|nr:hypothetical protein [Bacteroidales bacterium]MCF8387964.1 hypothetical protein [Bacteroidales bacterium]